MNKTIVTKNNAYIGMKVVRGRDWKWGRQNGSSKFGTIMDSSEYFPRLQHKGWVEVRWKDGYTYQYQIGANDIFDLYVYEEEFVLPEKWCIPVGDIESGRWFDKQCNTNCYATDFEQGFLHSENRYGKSIKSLGEKEAFFYDDEIRAGFTQITIEQFKKYVMKETSETVTLSIYQMNEIVRMACQSWKPVLMNEYWYAMSNQLSLVITKERFQEYLDASTEEQKEKFKELFPEQFKLVLPDIKPGTLVYVKHSDGTWMMRYFSHFTALGRARFFNKQLKEGTSTVWDEYSLTNPLEG